MMFRKFLLPVALVLALSLPVAGAENPLSKLTEGENLEGICVMAVPENGTLLLGNRAIRSGDILTASQVDSLTGALTLREFRERFNALCREKGTGCAFLMIDMDYFRRVNNNLGHVRGDELLYEAVETMKSCLYPDEFIGRIGGDEFAVR